MFTRFEDIATYSTSKHLQSCFKTLSSLKEIKLYYVIFNPLWAYKLEAKHAYIQFFIRSPQIRLCFFVLFFILMMVSSNPLQSSHFYKTT